MLFFGTLSNRRLSTILTLLMISLPLAGCLELPSFMTKKNSASMTVKASKIPKVGKADVKQDANGVKTVGIPGDSDSAYAIDGFSGTNVVLPPGALAIGTDITIQEAGDWSLGANASTLNIEANLTAASPAITVSSPNEGSLQQALTIAIPYTGQGNLRLAGNQGRIHLIYKVKDIDDPTKEIVGVIESSGLVFKNNKVIFFGRFGTYQIVESAEELSANDKAVFDDLPIVAGAPVKAETKMIIMTEADTAPEAVIEVVVKNNSIVLQDVLNTGESIVSVDIPEGVEIGDDIGDIITVLNEPITVTTITPIVAKNGDTITLSGSNFRQTMTIALANTSVGNIDVMSDVSASFVVPATSFGFKDLTITQEGVTETAKLFAMADRTAYPLITVGPASVCSGVTYYDANGDVQTGTKSCSSASGDMLKSTYDTNADGAVDFAQGAQGTSITAASTITIPTNGTFFEVNGATSINEISTSSAGKRVTLLFNSVLTMVHSDSGPTLKLKGAANYTSTAGEMLELISTSSGWIEVNRLTALSNFHGQTSTLTLGPGAGSSTTALTEIIDTRGEFSSNQFTVTVSGDYEVEFNYSGSYNSSPTKKAQVYGAVKKNGGSLGALSETCWTSLLCEMAAPKSETVSLLIGDIVALSLWNYDSGGAVDFVFTDASTYLKIRKI